jgi:glycosyltransferase involved in cell wall biosynthesis
VRRAVFLVSKQPFGAQQDGETAITRLLLGAAAESCDVSAIALADRPGPPGEFPVREIAKPPLRMSGLVMRSVVRRRSLLHMRFAPPELVEAVAHAEADVLVARRLYMGQAALDAGRTPPGDRLVALADVLESKVMRTRKSPLRLAYSVEARRTWADEVRCARAASAVAYFSDTERRQLEPVIGGGGPRLDLVLPSAEAPAGLDDPIAIFIGDRRWAPNRDALDALARVWPRIVRAVGRARLVIVGRPGPGERALRIPNSTQVGFVEDLDAVWRSAGLLIAPVRIGGGVRVKILDAAARGVPVVGTGAAMGSAGAYLPLSAVDSDQELVESATALLGDIGERRRQGRELFEANRRLNRGGFVERQLEALLLGGP